MIFYWYECFTSWLSLLETEECEIKTNMAAANWCKGERLTRKHSRHWEYWPFMTPTPVNIGFALNGIQSSKSIQAQQTDETFVKQTTPSSVTYRPTAMDNTNSLNHPLQQSRLVSVFPVTIGLVHTLRWLGQKTVPLGLSMFEKLFLILTMLLPQFIPIRVVRKAFLTM